MDIELSAFSALQGSKAWYLFYLDKSLLKQCEAIGHLISEVQANYVKIGVLLEDLADSKAIMVQFSHKGQDGIERMLGFDNFEAACQGIFGFSARRANQYRQAAWLANTITVKYPGTPLPSNESHVRQLEKLPDEHQAPAWAGIVHERHEATGKAKPHVTAKQVRESVKAYAETRGLELGSVAEPTAPTTTNDPDKAIAQTMAALRKGRDVLENCDFFGKVDAKLADQLVAKINTALDDCQKWREKRAARA